MSARRLAPGELSLMRMLWQHGSVSLSEAHRAMQELEGDVGYTTIQTRLDRLVAKQVVTKTATRPARYEALLNPDEVSRPLLALLLERVSGAVPLVANLVRDPLVSDDDLREMQRLIRDARRDRGTKA